MIWNRTLAVSLCLLGACIEAEPNDEDSSVREQPLLPNGGTVHVALVPYYFTDSAGAEIARLTGGSGWNLQDLMFTGTGTDGATGSVKGFWNAVSSNAIGVEGEIYSWIPVLTLDATDFNQRELWRPQDDWYIPPNNQVAGYNCALNAWGSTPETTNKTVLLAGTPGLFLCQDPESDLSTVTNQPDHFWALDGNGAYTATSVCPLGGTAQPPQAGTYYCKHRNLQVIDNVNHSWALAGANRLPPGINSNGGPVTTAYDPAAWEADSHVTLYGYPTRNAGNAASSRRVYVPLAVSNRPYALYNGVHESGHALGLQHASSVRCTNAAGVSVPLDRGTNNCTTAEEYGPHNFMGGASTEFGDGYNLLAVGAIPPGNLTTITTSGSFPLAPLASTRRVLRVPTGLQANAMPEWPSSTGLAYYYLDHRAPLANTFDQSITPSFTGVEVKLAPDFASEQTRCGTGPACTKSVLLDVHPETTTFDDATMKTGQSLTDRVARITMQTTLGTAPHVDVTFTPSTTKLMFTTIGGGSGYTDRQEDGALTNVQTIAGFSPWTIIGGTNNSCVVFYNAGLLWKAHIDANNLFQSQGPVAGTAANVAGWTSITPVGRNNLIFFNATTGAYVIAALGDNASSFTVLKSSSWSGGWTAVAGVLNGGFVKYRASDGRLERGTIDGEGNAFTTGGLTTITAGFTRVAAVREDGLAFYNGATGAVRIAQLDDARVFTLQGTTTVSANYSAVAGGMRGHLLFYRASDGAALRANVDASYNPVQLTAATSPGANLLVTSAGGHYTVPSVPSTPGMHVDFTQCVSGTPKFVIDWWSVGAAPVLGFDVDLKKGIGAPWEHWYDGTAISRTYSGSSGRNDGARVRACNVSGCSAYRTEPVNWTCGNTPPF